MQKADWSEASSGASWSCLVEEVAEKHFVGAGFRV